MIKRRNYTFALTQDNERIIKLVKKYPKYAYIKHDKDDAEPHYHYYIEFPNPRAISAVASELKIPENMIQQVFDKRGILNYLTHENSNGKFHYDKSEIITNMDLLTEVENTQNKITHEEYWTIVNAISDYNENKLTFKQLAEKMEPLFLQYTSARIFDLFIKASRNVGACPTFRVPCSNTSVSGTKLDKKTGGKMT